MSKYQTSSGNNPRFSYSVTGGAKRNAVVNRVLHSQHDRNLETWQKLVDSKVNTVDADVYYNNKLDVVVVAREFVYTQDEKDQFNWKDHLWMTLISRPRFHLAPFCRVESRIISLENKDFGEVIEEKPIRQVYDLKFFVTQELDVFLNSDTA